MRRKSKKYIDFLENGKILWTGVVIIFLLTCLSLMLDNLIAQSNCLILQCVEWRINKAVEKILDAFYIIWGMTITVVLFLFEFGNTYWYGVNLKRIIHLSLNENALMFVAAEYVLLCPVVCFSNVCGKGITCLWGFICVFVTFCVTVLYIIYKVRKQEIKRVLKNSTIEEIKHKIHRISELHLQREHLQNEIEMLSVVDMIKHIEYNDTAEVKGLIDTLSAIINDEEILSIIKGTQYEHIIIMTWVKHIIHYSGISTEGEKERTQYVLRKFWENITSMSEEEAKNKADYVSDKTISLTIQILCPLIEIGTSNAEEVFQSLWKSMKPVQAYSIWYLFLYEEYLHYGRGKEKRDYCILMDMVEKDQKILLRYSALWNQTMAWTLWRSWITLKEFGNNLALALFFEFCRDVGKIKRECIYDVKTHTMRRYYWGTR